MSSGLGQSKGTCLACSSLGLELGERWKGDFVESHEWDCSAKSFFVLQAAGSE